MPGLTEITDSKVLLEIGETGKAVGAVLKSPSFWTDFGEGTKVVGTSVAHFISGIAAGKDLYDDISDDELKWYHKATSGALNAGRFGVAVVAFIGICGATVLAAPVLAVVIGSSSLVKNTFDFVKTRFKQRKIAKEIQQLEATLADYNLKFDQNNSLHKDINNSHKEIVSLKAQLEATQHTLASLEQSQPQLDNISLTAQLHDGYLSRKIHKSQILAKSAQSIVDLKSNVSDILDGPNSYLKECLSHEVHLIVDGNPLVLSKQEVEKLDSLHNFLNKELKAGTVPEQEIESTKNLVKLIKKTNIEGQVKRLPDEIRVLNLAKQDLETQRSHLKEGTMAFSKNEIKIEALQRSIDKKAIQLSSHEKTLALIQERKDLLEEQSKLHKKYQAYDPDVGKQLMNLNQEYIEQRLQVIDDKLDPELIYEKRQAKVNSLTAQKKALCGAIVSKEAQAETIKTTLLELLTSEQEKLKNKIENKETVLREKVKYTSVFLDQDAGLKDLIKARQEQEKLFDQTIIPLVDKQEQLANLSRDSMLGQTGLKLEITAKRDASNILKLQTQVSERKQVLAKINSRKFKRIKNIFFGTAMTGLAIAALAFPPSAIVLAGVGIGVGISAGISNIYDYVKTHRAEKKAKTDYAGQVNQCLERLDKEIEPEFQKQQIEHKQRNTLTSSVKKMMNQELLSIAKGFVPQPEELGQSDAGQRVIHLLNDAVQRILTKEEIIKLSPKGREQLEDYLKGTKLEAMIYDKALQSRVDYFYDKLLDIDKLNLLDSKQTGLNWVQYPRARRELIEQLFKKAQKDPNNFNSSEDKKRALGKLKEIYIETIKQDLKIMPSQHVQAFLDTLKHDHVLVTPTSLNGVEKQSHQSLMAQLHQIAHIREDTHVQDELYSNKTSPGFDINQGLLAKLESCLKDAPELENGHPMTGHDARSEHIKQVKQLYDKSSHIRLKGDLLGKNPIDRLEAIEKLVNHAKDSTLYTDYSVPVNGEILNASKKYTPTQSRIVSELQTMGLETLPKACEHIWLNHKENPSEQDPNTQINKLCDRMASSLISMNPDKKETIQISIQAVRDSYQQQQQPSMSVEPDNTRSKGKRM